MRIIGGEHRGRRIVAPKGRATRPMLDRVREAVFSSVAPWIPEGRVLDLFAGSGSLGLEALSRGAASARFIERNERTAGLVRDNIETLRLEERAKVITGDALAPYTWGEEPLDLVFLDPPYPMVQVLEDRLRVLAAVEILLEEHLAPDGVIVFHVPRGLLDERSFPEGAEKAERIYGSNALWYLSPASEEQNGEGMEEGKEQPLEG